MLIHRSGTLSRGDGKWHWWASNQNDAFIRDQIWVSVEEHNTGELQQLTVAVDAKPFRAYQGQGAEWVLDIALTNVAEAAVKDWDALVAKYKGTPIRIEVPRLPEDPFASVQTKADTQDSLHQAREDMRRTLAYTEPERRDREVKELILAELQAQTKLLQDILHKVHRPEPGVDRMGSELHYPEPSTPYVTDEAEILHDIRELLAELVRTRQ